MKEPIGDCPCVEHCCNGRIVDVVLKKKTREARLGWFHVFRLIEQILSMFFNYMWSEQGIGRVCQMYLFVDFHLVFETTPLTESS